MVSPRHRISSQLDSVVVSGPTARDDRSKVLVTYTPAERNGFGGTLINFLRTLQQVEGAERRGTIRDG
ncbi:hypothetical protein MFRU_003g04600 [Monilinia fructicola]|nr:hypothetical protein MFRU_003g04600 [Monilinia fructicola]